MRLVVTGHTPDGRAVVASDGEVPSFDLGGPVFHRAWAADEPPSLPDDGAPPAGPLQHFPPVGGVRFGVFTLPAHGTVELDDRSVDPLAIEAELPGLLAHMEADDPGMHRSASVDFLVVLSGRASLELDDGVVVELAAGDACIQRGTRHRWSNPFAEPCTIALTMIGARHALVDHPAG